MLPIQGVYEVAIKVKDLPRAEAFYKDVLGLEEGIRDEGRNYLFLYAGGRAGMVVLQEDKGDWPKQHFAFTINEADLGRAADMLKAKGVVVSEPVFHKWMKSVSLYFDDPDGHALELIALSGAVVTRDRGRGAVLLDSSVGNGAILSFSLCNLRGLRVSVVNLSSESLNHRDTEHTEDAQRFQIATLPRPVLICHHALRAI